VSALVSSGTPAAAAGLTITDEFRSRGRYVSASALSSAGAIFWKKASVRCHQARGAELRRRSGHPRGIVDPLGRSVERGRRNWRRARRGSGAPDDGLLEVAQAVALALDVEDVALVQEPVGLGGVTTATGKFLTGFAGALSGSASTFPQGSGNPVVQSAVGPVGGPVRPPRPGQRPSKVLSEQSFNFSWSRCMGYTEVRLQREIHQLRNEMRGAKAREAQTRQGCLDLVHALTELVTSLEASGMPTASRFNDLLGQAGGLLAPDATACLGPGLQAPPQTGQA